MKRLLIPSLISAFFLSLSLSASAERTCNGPRGLVVGASISAGVLARSPAIDLVRAMGVTSECTDRAYQYFEGSWANETFIEEQLASRQHQIFLGLDLFYHNLKSRPEPTAQDQEDVRRLIRTIGESGVYSLLGETFSMFRGKNPHASEMAEILVAESAKYPKIFLLPVREFYDQIRSDSLLSCDGSRNLEQKEVLLDRVHVSNLGADMMRELVQQFMALFVAQPPLTVPPTSCLQNSILSDRALIEKLNPGKTLRINLN